MILNLNKISKQYNSGSESLSVLEEISLKVEEGDTISIKGPSGSGKSTLLNIMGALDRPSSGTISLNGEDFAGLSDKELSAFRSRHIGFIFQLHHLLPQCTVLENVLVPTLASSADKSGSRERALGLLQRAGLEDRLNALPSQLSGGERQRTAFARALINKPRLVLADEPTGSLDNRSAEKLADLLTELNSEDNTTLIVVTHSSELAGRMKRQYELHDGKLSC